jgi:hypothetical protein
MPNGCRHPHLPCELLVGCFGREDSFGNHDEGGIATQVVAERLSQGSDRELGRRAGPIVEKTITA